MTTAAANGPPCTDAGVRRLRAAAPTHLRGVSEHFLDRLTPDELASLERMLDSIGER